MKLVDKVLSKVIVRLETFVPASLFLPKYRTDHLIIETVLGQETILKTTDSFQKRDQISLK